MRKCLRKSYIVVATGVDEKISSEQVKENLKKHVKLDVNVRAKAV